jgi:hypothetical protein
MFGRMVSPVVQFDPGVDLPAAVAALVKVTESVEIVRWIELPASPRLFLPVPGDPYAAESSLLVGRKTLI